MTPEPVKFGESLERLQARSRLRREEGGVPAAEGAADPELLFDLTTDGEGREYATRIATPLERRADSWAKMMSENGLPADLPERHRLSEDQLILANVMARGVKNAVLHGPSGTGKTAVVLTALKELHMDGRSVLATRFIRMKEQHEPRWLEQNEETAETVRARYVGPEILFLDEVGYGDEKDRRIVSEHERHVLFNVISEREAAGRYTWLTTNQTIEKLTEQYGETLMSRLTMRNGCIKANFKDEPNYRYTEQKPAPRRDLDG